MTRLLQHNPDPIRLVDRAVRDVWTKLPGWRCNHVDGRGQCTSRETSPRMGNDRIPAWYCERHMPGAGP